MNDYEKFVDHLARLTFEGRAKANITDTMKEYEKDHPDMWYQVELKAKEYAEKAKMLRETNSEEYLEGLERYNEILEEIKESLKKVPSEVFGKETSSFVTTKEQDKELRSLLYVGVLVNEYDIRSKLNAFVRAGGEYMAPPSEEFSSQRSR